MENEAKKEISNNELAEMNQESILTIEKVWRLEEDVEKIKEILKVA